MLSIPAFAAVYEEYTVHNEFYSDLDGTYRVYDGPNVGANETDYTCEKADAYYLQSLYKKALIGGTQIGSKYNFQVNTGTTWCSRWVNANPNGDTQFKFYYEPKNDAYSSPYDRVSIIGDSTYLSES